MFFLLHMPLHYPVPQEKSARTPRLLSMPLGQKNLIPFTFVLHENRFAHPLASRHQNREPRGQLFYMPHVQNTVSIMAESWRPFQPGTHWSALPEIPRQPAARIAYPAKHKAVVSPHRHLQRSVQPAQCRTDISRRLKLLCRQVRNERACNVIGPILWRFQSVSIRSHGNRRLSGIPDHEADANRT